MLNDYKFLNYLKSYELLKIIYCLNHINQRITWKLTGFR